MRNVTTLGVLSAVISSSLASASTLQLKDFTGPECGTVPVIEESPVCGVASYNLGSDPSCGAITEFRADPSCGVASYNTAASSSCGVATYKERADAKVCGKESKDMTSPWDSSVVFDCASRIKDSDGFTGWANISLSRKDDPAPCEAERHANCMPKFLYSSLCRGTKPKKCRNSAFGVESYNTCAHLDHGIASYNSCSVTVGYNTCRSEIFKVEKYNSCQTGTHNKTCSVYFTADELSGYIAAENNNFAPTIDNLVNWSNTFFKVAGDVGNMGCLIQNIVTNSGFAGDHVFDAVVLDGLQSSYKIMSGKDFDLADFTESVCTNPLNKIKNYVCSSTDSSSICTAKSGYLEAVKDAKAKLADYKLLYEDVVVKANSESLSILNKWKVSLENIILEANGQ